MAKLIYTVDDEENILEIINFNLEKNGYSVKGFSNGKDFLAKFRQEKPDLVILDLMLPDMDGYEICRIIKAESQVPVLILSARGEELDKVLGLELGAEDYVVKPFGLHELMARVKNILKRADLVFLDASKKILKSKYEFDGIDVSIDETRHEVTLEGSPVHLNPKEFSTLVLLMKDIDNLVTRNDLIRLVWGDDYYGDTRTLDVHIRRIREKMAQGDFGSRYIKTVHGIGYKLISSVKK